MLAPMSRIAPNGLTKPPNKMRPDSYIACEAPAVARNASHVSQPNSATDSSTSVAAETPAATNARQCPPIPSASGTSSAKCGL